jgi:spore germination protein KB
VKISDGKIGTREFVSLIALTIGAKISDITPNLLIPHGKVASWLIPIISTILIIGPFLLLIIVLKKYETKNLIEVIYITAGKYVGFLIAFILFIIMFSTTTLNSRGYVEIVASMFYQETPHSLIYLLILGGAYFIANRGLEAIGRTAWLALPYIKLSLLIYIILIWKEVHFDFLFPILGPGLKDLVVASTKQSTILGEFFLLAILFPLVRKTKDYTLGSYIGLGIAVIELSFFLALYLMVFDYPHVERLGYPFHHIARILSLGEFISNLEGIFLTFWVITGVIRFGIMLYLTAMYFSFMLKIKEFEPLLLPLTTLIFILGLLPENVATTMFVFRSEFLIQGGAPVFLFLPVILWVLSLRKKENAL